MAVRPAHQSDATRGKALRRVGLVGFGLLLTLALLALVEGLLALLDLGEGRPGRDPLAGFSRATHLFERDTSSGGEDIYRFTSARPGSPSAQRIFSAHKPPGRFRIFVIGGSTAAGVPYPVELGFSGWLERMIQAALPQVDLEVVNAAVSGYASRRVLLAAREIADYEPDLVIVYTGHNEWAERRLYGDLIDRHPLLFGLQEWFYGTRIFNLASRLRPDREPTPEEAARALSQNRDEAFVQMFAVIAQRADGASPYATDAQATARDRWYRANVERIEDVARGAGARVLFVTLTQNFADWPPGASAHRSELTADEKRTWDAAYEAGRSRAEQGQWHAALRSFARALEIDDRHAALHYHFAACLRELGRYEEAQAHYRLASDLDRVPHGAPTQYNAMLKDLARSRGALLADAAAAFEAQAPNGLPGDSLFIDFVHPRLGAHQKIAAVLADTLRAADLPAPAQDWATDPFDFPDPERLLADPALRGREIGLAMFACGLAQRKDCAREQARKLERFGVELSGVARAFLRNIDEDGENIEDGDQQLDRERRMQAARERGAQ